MDKAEFATRFRCENGHEQELRFGPGFSEDMVHDHAVLVAGGRLRSIGTDVPGWPCRTCGAKVSFRVEDLRPVSPPPVDWSKREVLGEAVAPGVANTELKEDGKQRGYVVLSAEERALGFVRPVRKSYRHVGRPAPRHPVRDLTGEELSRYAEEGFVKFETYSDGSASFGRFWTQAELDSVGKGCGTVTTMGLAIAETYARDPRFYSGTYCCGCRSHFPVGADGEFVWDGTDERVGT